jgi:uncharacterized protein (TIGR03067 family)
MRKLLPCIAVVLALGAADAPKDEAKTAAKEIIGSWKGVSVETLGLKSDLITDWEIKDTEIIFTFRGRPTGTYTYRLDAKKSPREIDLTPKDGGQTRRGIWKVEKDKLTMCIVRSDVTNAGKRKRPRTFSSRARNDVEVLTLKRKAS